MIAGGLRKSGNILYVGVARVSDKAIVASSAVQKGDVEDKYYPNVREVLNAPDFSRKVQIGSRYRLTTRDGLNAFSFIADAEQRLYMVITLQEYSERLTFQLLNELQTRFKDLAPAALTCAPGGLDSKARRIFQALALDFDDPTKTDKLSIVQEQVEGVTRQMQENVGAMFKNIDSASNIENKSKDLMDSAQLFNKHSAALHRMELCRKYKITACIVLATIVLILIIVLSLVGPSLGAKAAVAPAPAPAPPPPSSEG